MHLANKKKTLLLIVVSLIIISSAITIAYVTSIPSPGHGADTVTLQIDGYDMTLQDAIDHFYIYLEGPRAKESLPLPTALSTHPADQVIIYSQAGELTLQDAINTKEDRSLCPGSNPIYSNTQSKSHNADSILVEIEGFEKTLQQAINDNDLCSDPYYCDDYGGEFYTSSFGSGCLFDKPGNYVYDIPKAFDEVQLVVVGAGGSGGTRDHSHWNSYGGAGGGAAITNITNAAQEQVSFTLGNGGTKVGVGWGFKKGKQGQESTLTTHAGQVIRATGGRGGHQDGVYNQQAVGGIGIGGDFNYQGGTGINGRYQTAVGGTGECNGGVSKFIPGGTSSVYYGPGGSAGAASFIGGDSNRPECGSGTSMASNLDGGDGCVAIMFETYGTTC